MRFTVAGKEYELKLTFESVKHLNKAVEGGALGLIGKVFTGDVETFIQIIHAGLFHTEENIAFTDVEEEVAALFEKGELTLDTVLKISNELVSDSFFYKPMVNKMMKDNKEAMEQLEKLLK